MKFRYGRYEVDPTPAQPGVTVVYRPVIPLRLIGQSGGATFYGLLDTGADETLIPAAMAELVGLAVDPAQTSIVLSASGEMRVRYGEVTIEAGQGKVLHRWRTTVGVVEQTWNEALLGHAGFLRYFDVTLCGAKREVQLRRNTAPFPGT